MTIDETAERPALPCYLLKSHTRNPNFFGREDVLLQLEKTLLPEEKIQMEHLEPSPEPKIFAICGIGGVGKTQIAVELH